MLDGSTPPRLDLLLTQQDVLDLLLTQDVPCLHVYCYQMQKSGLRGDVLVHMIKASKDEKEKSK